jgi:type I restriction enzyme, S subunit
MAVWTSIHLSDVRSGFRIDSEFYKEEYIQMDHVLFTLKRSSLGQLAKVTDGEHGSVMFVTEGIKYLTAEHVKQGYVDFTGVRFVGPEVDQRNARARVNAGDVLISIKGTLGEVAVAEAQLLPANMNRDVAIIKPYQSAPSGFYISAFLRSSYGSYQLAREGSGGVQQMITLERLRNVQIPLLSEDSIVSIAREYQQALGKRQESVNLYTQAQQLHNSELEVDKVNNVNPIGYTARYSESILDGRIDAEFYQPKYRLIRKSIRNYKHGFQSLLGICSSLKANIDPSKKPNVSFNYIELSNIDSCLGVIDGTSTSQGADLPSRARRKVSKGDVLASSVVGSINKSALIYSSQDGYIASTGFFHLRPLTVSTEYLLILMRSNCVQMQLQQESTGGILSAVPDSRLRNVIIPNVPNDIQDQISDLVRKSHEKKAEANQLLSRCNERVEELIVAEIQT